MHDGLDILLIEDDLDARSNFCDILDMDGHRVEVAGSAAEARKIAANSQVNTVILDRKLPDGTAEDLLPDLRGLLPTADLIVVTGFADLNSSITALRHGVTDYILKPINPDALRASLDKIARRRRVEKELSEEQRFADLILETAEAIILVLDLDAKIIRHNSCLERMTGWTLEETVGENWFALFVPDEDHERIREAFSNTAMGMKTGGIVNRILTKDRRERHIRWSNSTLRDERGQISAVLAIGTDITDQIRDQEQALQSQRLAVIGQTMTGLAHESRNALQRIQASLDLLQLELVDHPETQSDLNSIRRASNDIQTLLEEVRAFASPINLHLEPFNLADLWRRAWQSIHATWQARDVDFQEVLLAQDLTVSVDVLRIEQVFRNLFENALQACTDPVKISIRCTFADDDRIEVIISDNGPGLSAEQRERVFDAFFTTKSVGTGLGMAIVQRIVESHEGNISTGSTSMSDQEGASFTIQLPRDPRKHKSSGEQDAIIAHG